MRERQTVIQSSNPTIKIKRLNGLFLKDVLEFSSLYIDCLQSYSFSLSTKDPAGSFSLSFFPDKDENLFDKIEIMDIVEICESKKELKSVKSILSAGTTLQSTRPVFTGVVKSKKYVAQVTDNGIMRRLQVAGISAAGLVSQFYLNLDTNAMAITGQIAETESLRNQLTISVAGNNKPMKTVVSKVWDFFCNLAETYGTVAIKSLLDACVISGIFSCDETVIPYPIANIALGEQTQNFYSLIGNIVPEPVYERFASMDFLSGKMKVVMRQVPFSPIKWKSVFNRNLKSTEVKSFDFTQSDNEVYTAFFSYLDGYPAGTDMLMRIAAQKKNSKNPSLLSDTQKYKLYGYRPLIATFKGYDRTKLDKDVTTETNLATLNANLKEWFGNLDRMFSGSVTLAMTYEREKPIMPGDVIGFLGGQFYVEGIVHNWNYGANGEINLSLSRGGNYDAGGKFHEFKKITDKVNLFEKKGAFV